MTSVPTAATVPVATLVEIAIAAGAAILPHYSPAGTAARIKGDGSPVTVADEAAEAIILARLAEHGITNVVAEEAAAAGRTPDVGAEFWLVDPLDGTKEFVSGSGEFTVNIARIVDGRPVAGVVLCPALGEVFWGDETGAFSARVVDGKVIESRMIQVAAPAGRLRVVASKSHLDDETKAFVARFAVESFVSFGSSLKFCRVADGTADLYPRMGRTMEWDTAAGHAVLGAAGGEVYCLDGTPLRYGKTTAPTGPFANPYFVASGPFDPFLRASASASA